MKLALRLGMTLSQLEESMTAREFYLWVGFDQVNPIGDERADIQSAQITSAIYQSVGAKITLNDVLLAWEENPETDKTSTLGLEDLFQNIINVQGK